MSWALEKISIILRAPTNGSVTALRSVNTYPGSVALFLLVRKTLNWLAQQERESTGNLSKSSESRLQGFSQRRLGHAAVNICLFPPLFFFYGLYYTDVLSALSFLVTYYFHVRNQQNKLIFAGLVSLLFRQTNVFWSGVFLGGLQLCRTLPRGRADVEFPRKPTFFDIIGGSWDHSCAYDPPAEEAFIEGMDEMVSTPSTCSQPRRLFQVCGVDCRCGF